MSLLLDPFGDEHHHRELMQRGKLDLLRLCPGCGMRSLGESMRRCAQCQDFADRSMKVTDADFAKAVADGLIVPPKDQKQ